MSFKRTIEVQNHGPTEVKTTGMWNVWVRQAHDGDGWVLYTPEEARALRRALKKAIKNTKS